jgi:hypothetical protein
MFWIQAILQWTDLQVLVRVPVAVIDDDRVSGGQVDAQATSTGGQQEQPCLLQLIMARRIWSASRH